MQPVVSYGLRLLGPFVDSCKATLKTNSRSLIRFDAEVDYHERHRFIKFELPLAIRAHEAIYETQFGHVSRPTHKNTTWVS